MMTILTISSFLLTILALGVAIGRMGELPESISAMVYDIPKRYQWTWSAWLLLVGGLTMIPMTDVLAEKGLELFGFLTMAPLCFVAVMPLTNKDTVRTHYVLSILAVVMSQVCVAIVNPWCLALWGLMILYKLVPRILLEEGICYAGVIGCLVINQLKL